MPELPEVETIVRELRKKIVGLKITDVWVDWPKTVKQAGGIDNFKKQIKNKKILSIRRRAKYIIMDIEGEKTLFIHQKISGHLLYGKWSRTKSRLHPIGAGRRFSGGLFRTRWVSDLPGPLRDDRRNGYIRFMLILNNGYQLALSDLRRFGKVILVDDDKVKDLKEISGLGPEPLEINFKEFKKLFDKKRGRIKQVLMDPTFIAGVGNIYADEILWASDLHPLSRTENLEDKDIKNIFDFTVKILKKAIKYKGSSIDDYRIPSGEKGRFQNIQNAYQKTGEKCKKKDGGVIERIKLGGRSAHFCPKHQILK
ncbi:MAG: Formamidopyrimidine-DNA glycosylase [Candidatus Yanofskybacteria bacterium GW2011_GWA1_41_6]|uniref:Formamidopyrimidine-DNA glycosylase n=1 Tax=Candidatus Yanofskybacteria bacterium GW2011_GWA1_41_6 TaxID=1619020 RepID=A0A0G0WPI7_9BACT|nr:MAG: Formamidopyrimidine-DNA glycosylase [Candidatus Yanofskybacteria bacterium GW2011_GWA1_41_6]